MSQSSKQLCSVIFRDKIIHIHTIIIIITATIRLLDNQQKYAIQVNKFIWLIYPFVFSFSNLNVIISATTVRMFVYQSVAIYSFSVEIMMWNQR